MSILTQQFKKVFERAGWYVRKTRGLSYGISLGEDINRLCGVYRICLVYDVGAHHGQTARLFADIFPTADIFSFEPISASFKDLQSTTSRIPRIHPIQAALGEACRRQVMALHGYSQINSLKPELNRLEPGGRSEEVEVRTLDSVARDFGHARIDLLKIDAEGYELDVLRGAAQSLAAGQIRLIFAEATLRPDDIEHTQLSELIAFLGSHGFDIVTIYDQAVLEGRHLGYFNALFMKRGFSR